MVDDIARRRAHILNVAMEVWEAGMTPIPTVPDNPKRPTMRWKPYIDQSPTRQEVAGWFRRGWYGQPTGIAVVTGADAQNLMIEFEGRAIENGLDKDFAEAMRDAGLEDLHERLVGSWVESTPSGGVHYFVHLSDAKDAFPSAKRFARDEDGLVLMETRGQGGYSVIYPTTSEKGNWIRKHGSPKHIATFTLSEYNALAEVACSLDRYKQPERPQRITQPRLSITGNESDKPWVEFNQKADWNDILASRGWTLMRSDSVQDYWRRPGKNDDSVSATVNHQSQRLYVFSTSTDFEPNRPYSKFDAYALLYCGGDSKAAARQLLAQGFGKPLKKFPRQRKVGECSLPDVDRKTTGNAIQEVKSRPALPTQRNKTLERRNNHGRVTRS